jgi:predicted permease
MSAGRAREELPALYGRLADRLAALPGVERVAFSQVPLLAHSSWTSSVTLQDGPQPEGNDANVVMNGVDAAFFATYQLPLRLGRGFTGRDTASAPHVAVVNEAFAKKFYGDRPAIGHFIGFGGPKGGIDIEIVGVVADAKYVTLEEKPRPTAFFPFSQIRNARFGNFALRITGEPLALGPAVQTALHEVDPTLPLYHLRTQEGQIASLLTGERLFARLSACFGLLALGLAAIGLYGLMSYSVLQRTGELGLRMALGALPAGLLRLVILETLALVAAGLVLGGLSAWALSRLVAALLFGLTPTDPATYAAAMLALLATGVLAAWLPARRAAKVDPMVALRAE